MEVQRTNEVNTKQIAYGCGLTTLISIVTLNINAKNSN
jgi:hypothetical protein